MFRMHRSLATPALITACTLAGCPVPSEPAPEDPAAIEVAFDGAATIVALAAGEQHSALLAEDGTVWTSGNNSDGELGFPESTGLLEAFAPVPDVEDVVDVSAGSIQTFLLYADGTAEAFGWNGDGQLGTGGSGDRQFGPAAVQTAGLVALAASGNHTLAIDDDGDALGWGWNVSGAVGDNSTEERRTPVALPVLEDVVAVDAGGQSSAAVTEDGTLYTWGGNGVGQLGDAGDGPNALAPQVLDVSFDAVDVAVGSNHMLAIDTDGRLWAWGENDQGQLGLGTETTVERPTRIEGLEDVVAVDAGSDWSLALTADGSVWVWGAGSSGQLGAGPQETGPALAPQQVEGLVDVVSIEAGTFHALALDADGDVFAWGLTDMGQLGLPIADWQYRPVQVF